MDGSGGGGGGKTNWGWNEAADIPGRTFSGMKAGWCDGGVSEHWKKFGCGIDVGNGGPDSGLKVENCGGMDACIDGGKAGCMAGCDGNAGDIADILAALKLE